ncbi:hypothetical protein [Hyphomonas sp.]|uniref:hypothetical protein n=1 Tax=Hyphomonas sp. TaxID=87 RepID=UPI0025BDD388|nr:hypothetical protein [Hyphomonas sp.]
MATYALADGNNSAISDDDGIHANGIFTVPAAWNGRKVRMQFQTLSEIPGATLYLTLLNGSSYDGAAAQYAEDVNSPDRINAVSAPVVVSAGDQFAVSGTLGASPLSWRQVEVFAAGLQGALVSRSASGFGIGTVATAVEWNNETYDTGGYHDNGVNPSRLTVPAGSSGLVRLSVGLEVDAGGQLYAELRKNGAYVSGLCFRADVQATALTAVSPPVAVTAGDFFEVYANTSAASNLLADSNCWFAIEELPSDLKHAIGLVTSNQAIPSGTTYTGGINMDAEVADTGGWFNAGDDHFTVPAGISKIRFGFSAQMNQSLGSMYASMGKNGATASNIGAGFAQHAATSDGIDYMHGWSGILDVVPGDVFYPIAATNAGGTSIASPSFWWVEEYRAPDDIPVVLEPGAGVLALTGYTPLVSGADTARNRVTIFIY